MPYYIYLILAIGMSISSSIQANTKDITQSSPLLPPQGYTELATVVGDLDGDGISETVVAYNTPIQSKHDFGWVRELIIYKQRKHAAWRPWQRSKAALLSSQGGGMSGDPFENIEVHKGVLHINHFGGSSWKWRGSDKYRYQSGKFKLIGHTSWSGKLCEEWTKIDINLNTTKTIYEKQTENCDSGEQVTTQIEKETFYYKKLRAHRSGILLTLQNRSPTDIIIKTPKYKRDIYVATAPIEPN